MTPEKKTQSAFKKFCHWILKATLTTGLLIVTTSAFHRPQSVFAKEGKPFPAFSAYRTLEKNNLTAFLKENNINSLEDYARWLTKHIRYQADINGDQWSTPTETLYKGFGDCEDFAFLSQAVLQALGYEAHVFVSVRPGYAHAFCAFKMNGVYAVFDNERLIRTKTSNLSRIIQYVTLKEKSVLFLEVNQDRKNTVVFYARNHARG